MSNSLAVQWTPSLPGSAPSNNRTNVRVVHGSNDMQFELHGKTVGTVRKSLRHDLNLPSDAACFIDGVAVNDERVIEEGEALEFLRPMGTKGLGALLTPEQLQLAWGLTTKDYEELLVVGLPLIRLGSGIRHPECAVDEFFRNFGNPNTQPRPEYVGTPYVADRLGCTETWVTQMIKRKVIPPSCVVPGTGNGRPWKLVRVRIDEWLQRR